MKKATSKADNKIIEKFREDCTKELGYIGAIFMSQGDTKAKDIIMPTEQLEEALDRFELYLLSALNAQKKNQYSYHVTPLIVGL